MRHLYEFHGFPISEEMLLGLGAGLGFVYWQMNDAPPFIGGRTNTGRPGEEGLEKAAGRRTGVLVRSSETSSGKKAEAALLDLLSRGEPVMVQVDMGFLPYFDFPVEYHFGGHVVVVAGYDVESGQCLVADRDVPLHPVSMEQLALARGSQFQPFPPKNRQYSFDFSVMHQPEPVEVREAIREVVKGTLEPPIANLGVKGIRTAAERCLKWPKTMAEETLRASCFNLFIFVDATGGTGGGIFRYMYGRFLQEAAGILGEDRLLEIGEEMARIGDQWQEVAVIFKEASSAPSPEGLIPEGCRLMRSIADREQGAWERLRGVIG